jgi:hypothetical protein
MEAEMNPIDIYFEDDHNFTYNGPAWNKDKALVPWSIDTGMLNYPQWYAYRGEPRAYAFIEPFESRMKLVHYSKGRSSMNFIMEAENGFQYPIRLEDFMMLVSSDNMVKGLSEPHKWVAIKKGANYFITFEKKEA